MIHLRVQLVLGEMRAQTLSIIRPKDILARKAYLVVPLERAQLERLILRLEHHIDHGAHFVGHNVLGARAAALALPLLERRPGVGDAGHDVVAGHRLDALLDVDGHHIVGPKEIVNEILHRVQLREDVGRRGTPGAALRVPFLLLKVSLGQMKQIRFHQVHVANDLRRKRIPQMIMESTMAQVF